MAAFGCSLRQKRLGDSYLPKPCHLGATLLNSSPKGGGLRAWARARAWVRASVGARVREDGKVARCGEGNLHAPYFLNLNVSKILLNVWAYKEESSFEG